jgi:hypothetical protein
VYQLSRTVPVNEPGKAYLSRHDVWTGLMMKAQNALPYVPQMQKCEVVEQGKGWLVRDILLNNVPLRERVSFEPEQRVIFDRVGGVELGRIENVIGEDEHGNLTLTFAFGLTKQGIAEGSDAERLHFSPMEGAYLGAVAATLAAVRRTVVDQGREKLPPASEIDVAGDNKWIYEFFRIADSMDMEGFLALHTEDVHLTFANYPTTVGKEALRAAIGGLWSRIKGMSHSLSGIWSLYDGRVGIAESTCMYTRQDDTLFTVRPCTVLRRRGDRIEELRIHVDTNGL